MAKKKPDVETRIEWMDIDAIPPHPENPKDHDLPAIMASMRAFGFRGAVILDERSGLTNEGHGRVQALKLMRSEDARNAPKNVRVEGNVKSAQKSRWLIPVVRGQAFANEDEARAFLIASNRLTELGGWNAKLDEIFASLDASLAGVTGFTAEAVARISAEALEEVDVDFGSDESRDPSEELAQGEKLPGVTKLVQVILSADQYEQFNGAMRVLSSRTGITGVSDLVFHAVLKAGA